MKKELTKEEFGELGEDAKEHYSPDGDVYKLDSIKELKSALDHERKARKDIRNEIETLKKSQVDLDFDVDEARAALKFKKEVDEKKLIDKGDYEAAKEKIQSEAQDKISAVEDKYKKLVRRDAKKTLALELIDKGVRKDLADLAVTDVLNKHIDITEKDGEIVFIEKGGVGDVADLEKVISDLKENRAVFFDSNNVTGSGARGDNGNGGLPGKWNDLTDFQKAEQIRKHGTREDAMKQFS